MIDIETLQKANAELFTTIDSVLNVQREGRQKRLAAEQELLNIETELKKKMRMEN
ncbi:MAG: toxic anion resistance protein [Bacteroidales bacterium]|nr:toxic anion resistance protein [Bacteroidales bacterium]